MGLEGGGGGGVGMRARGQRWGFDNWDDSPVWVLINLFTAKVNPVMQIALPGQSKLLYIQFCPP